MNELQVFNNEEFGQIRTVLVENEPWFVGKDVAEALGYKNTSDAIRKHVDDDDKGVAKRDTLGGCQGFTIINESGLYALTFASRLESAKKFRRWVTKEVLPTIRKTGGYVNNDDLFIQAYLPHADEGTKMLFKTTLSTVRSMSKQLEEQKPLVEFAETVQAVKDSKSYILVRECSKLASNHTGIDIGEKRLYEKLRQWGLVLKDKTEPSQRGRSSGALVLVERAGTKNGRPYVSYTTKVTPKGQMYIINKLINEFGYHPNV